MPGDISVASSGFKDLAVAVNVHREPSSQLFACVDRILRNLPGANLHVFGNGCCPSLKRLCLDMGVSFTEGENLGNNTYWYLWWRRMLEWFVATGRSKFLKLDPDSMVDRAPAWIPDADYFGCMDDWFIQGGCTGMSSRLAGRLLETEMLTSSIADRVRVAHRAFADDKYIARVIAELGITPVAWAEVKSQWRVPVPNEDLKFAIVHPRYYGS